VNWRLVARLMGIMLMVFAPSFLLPAILAALKGERESLAALGASAAITVAFGLGLRLLGARSRATIFRREALLVVALAWLVVPLFGALPFLLSGLLPSVTHAVFESISGFTTTGASVFGPEEFANAGHALHLWRLQTHWIGGLGITLLFVAILPSLGVGGKTLLRSEVSGPITSAEEPRVRVLLRSLLGVYVGLTMAQFVLLWALTPMTGWESLGHAMATAGTGGLSSNPSSIAGFESPAAAAIIFVFMLLFGTNLHLFVLLARGRWRQAWSDAEMRTYYAIVAVGILIVASQIVARHGGNVLHALGHAGFTVASVITTTGFMTDDWDAYPPLARTFLFILTFLGGCSGSTGGGLKVWRVLVLVRAAYAHALQAYRPNRVAYVRISGEILEPEVVRTVGVYFFSYIGLFVILGVLVSPFSPDLETALSASIACVANVGPGLAAVGPTMNYAHFHDSAIWMLSAGMLLGRIEIFPLLTVLSPVFWKR
jgi:trk system potassium uptake protein TrkH